MQAANTRPGRVRRFVAGIRFLGRGLGMWSTSPRLMLLGAIPALIVGILYVTAIVLFLMNLGTITTWVTPFAEGWEEPWRTGTRVVAGIGLVAATVLAALYTYTAITLAVGDPFYERIWREVERRAGGEPEDRGERFWTSVARGAGNGIRLLLATALVGLVLFACGFIPLVGQTVVPAVGALIGGWFLTVELTGFAGDARGMSLRERRRMLAADRAGTLGFGVLTYLLFLIPLAAIVVMPAAVAGATLLARERLTSEQVDG